MTDESATRAVLEAMLDAQRARVCSKLSGLSEDHARQSIVSSPTTVLGIVQHLTSVERWWFTEVVAGAPSDPAHEPGENWLLGATTLPEALAAYQAACDASREVSATVPSLATLPARDDFATRTYAWILAHMIEETARHLGHIDILTEQLDGRTGWL